MRSVLLELRAGSLDTRACASDTRPIHSRFFNGLTSPGCDYFAGHYRGDDYRCLKYYSVTVPNDPRVGAPPGLVFDRMNHFGKVLLGAVQGLDEAAALPAGQLAPADKLLYAVAVSCNLFVLFLTVHPYANGNGHAARFLLTALLGRYGYWLKRFPIEPKPPTPPYAGLIKTYRDGFPEPLEKFVLSCMRNA